MSSKRKRETISSEGSKEGAKRRRTASNSSQAELRKGEDTPVQRQSPRASRTCSKSRQHNQNEGGSHNTVPCKSKRTAKSYSRADFEDKYEEMEQLGEGGFGAVYAGRRKEDNLQVRLTNSGIIDGNLQRCPLEVMLMVLAGGQPAAIGKHSAVTLVDWFEVERDLVLVMERPVPSIDLFYYLETVGGSLQEEEAKPFMKQLVSMMADVHARGVLHRDLKLENILVETGTDTPRLRLIDFGCGCLLKNGLYRRFFGTTLYTPPEWFTRGCYRADACTVWQLGVLLYEILCGAAPFNTRREIISEEPDISAKLSPGCEDLLQKCLSKCPVDRASLEELQRHPWLN
ncbi:serine/threonine-protein kinase pim-2-like [Lampris incognitus]|uniref:serine/threonine-protein kinase pim-2-like n=1 Tax=Lampris incognitus TaxID=2546036 RepID=UPI0024B5612F|nr:serine/threonine-protein kinase pim-2-like [Lampris incognitus]